MTLRESAHGNIAGRGPELHCGVVIVDVYRGRMVPRLSLSTGVEEIFAVQVVPDMRFSFVSGPYAEEDGTPRVRCAFSVRDQVSWRVSLREENGDTVEAEERPA